MAESRLHNAPRPSAGTVLERCGGNQWERPATQARPKYGSARYSWHSRVRVGSVVPASQAGGRHVTPYTSAADGRSAHNAFSGRSIWMPVGYRSDTYARPPRNVMSEGPLASVPLATASEGRAGRDPRLLSERHEPGNRPREAGALLRPHHDDAGTWSAASRFGDVERAVRAEGEARGLSSPLITGVTVSRHRHLRGRPGRERRPQ